MLSTTFTYPYAGLYTNLLYPHLAKCGTVSKSRRAMRTKRATLRGHVRGETRPARPPATWLETQPAMQQSSAFSIRAPRLGLHPAPEGAGVQNTSQIPNCGGSLKMGARCHQVCFTGPASSRHTWTATRVSLRDSALTPPAARPSTAPRDAASLQGWRAREQSSMVWQSKP